MDLKKKLSIHSIKQIIIFVLILIGIIVFFLTKAIANVFIVVYAMLVVDIIYYVYVYNFTYKNKKEEQLTTLRYFRRDLFQFVIPGIFAYILFFFILGYKSPFEDGTIIIVGSFSVLSMICLIVCIFQIMIKKRT